MTTRLSLLALAALAIAACAGNDMGSPYPTGGSVGAEGPGLRERTRASCTSVSRKPVEAVRLSPSAVATRVQRLIDGGVIKISAVEARGLAHRQLSMGVGLNLNHDDDAVIEELRTGRGIDFAARTRGRFDAVATLVEPSAGALYASLERLRSLPGVTRIEAWLHLAVLKEDYARTLHAPALTRLVGQG